jgi:hypothetical protein
LGFSNSPTISGISVSARCRLAVGSGVIAGRQNLAPDKGGRCQVARDRNDPASAAESREIGFAVGGRHPHAKLSQITREFEQLRLHQHHAINAVKLTDLAAMRFRFIAGDQHGAMQSVFEFLRCRHRVAFVSR